MKNSNMKLSPNRLILILSTIFVYSAGLGPAKADITKIYVTTTCDQSVKQVLIKSIGVPNSEKPPYGSKLLSDVGDKGVPHNAVKICHLGDRRDVFLRGKIDLNHPRNDGLEIYTGTLNRPLVISLVAPPQIQTIKIVPEKTDYFIKISKCDTLGVCQDTTQTDPSFNCSKATSNIDQVICFYNDLRQYDVEIANLFSRLSQNGYNKFKADQRNWLINRVSICNIPKSSQIVNSNESLVTNESLNCLKYYYESRIKTMEKYLIPTNEQ